MLTSGFRECDDTASHWLIGQDDHSSVWSCHLVPLCAVALESGVGTSRNFSKMPVSTTVPAL